VAFEQAVRALSSRQRNLLRLQLIDGLSVDAISNVYNVHRVEKLNMSEQSFQSMVRLVESRLDVSIERVLRTQQEVE